MLYFQEKRNEKGTKLQEIKLKKGIQPIYTAYRDYKKKKKIVSYVNCEINS